MATLPKEPEKMPFKDIQAGLTREIYDALVSLDASILEETLKCMKYPCSSDGIERLEQIQEAVLLNGVKIFVNRLDKPFFISTCNFLSVEPPRLRLLQDAILSRGVIEMLKCISDHSLLNAYCKVLQLRDRLNPLQEKSIDEMRYNIADEIMLIGFDYIMQQLKLPLLQSYCNALNLESSPNRLDCVNRIVNHIFDLVPTGEYIKMLKNPEKNKKRKISQESSTPVKLSKTEEELDEDTHTPPSEKRGRNSSNHASPSDEGSDKEVVRNKTRSRHVAPPLADIKKGISAQDLHNLYNFKDLQEWCKMHQLDYIGKKGMLIKRILSYLDTGEVKEKKKKPKRVASPK